MQSDPDTLVTLTTARTDFEAQTIAEALRAQGIPTEVHGIVASTLQWDIASTDPIKVVVRREDLDRAKNTLRAIKADSVDIDWSEIDTGDRAPVACPYCNTPDAKAPAGQPCPKCGRPTPRIERAEVSEQRLTRSQFTTVLIIAASLVGIPLIALLIAFLAAVLRHR